MREHFCVKESVELGGMLQAIQVRGTDWDNPMLLVIHGGPGCPESGIAASYQQAWEERYTVVNWDQRYCGATALLSGAEPKSPFSVEDIMSDAHALTEYLLSRFHKEKIIVMGHSWGSVIGSQLVSRWPDLFSGYIGWGQIVNMVKGEIASAEHTRRIAEEQSDAALSAQMKALEPYPDFSGDSEAVVQKTLAYTAIKSAIGYNSFKYRGLQGYMDRREELARSNPDYPSEAIAYINNAMPYAPIVAGEVMLFDLLDRSPVFQVPVLFVFGDHDWQTPYTLAQEYLEKLTAPHKSFHLIADSGHSISLDNPEQFAQFMNKTAYEIIMQAR